MKRIYILFIILISQYAVAQNSSVVTGEYYLQGVMETASGFKINPDSTFHFFYTYGALDRFGSGTWKSVNNTIIFNSLPQPERDFALIKSEKRSGGNITLQIIDNNKIVLRYVDVIFKSENKGIQKTTDEKGMIQIPKESIDSIALLFRLCPDRYSTFNILNKDHNYFEFRLEPWVVEVFFKNFVLEFEDDQLKGKHPLLNGDSFRYEK